MIDTITEHQFVDEMIKHNEFSVQGSKVLFQYLDEINPDAEFDPVDIRCTYHEYENFKEIQKDYRNLSVAVNSIAELREHTIVLEVPNTDRLIILQF